jgi:NAD(P)-dependent dehydrogenase (short-subunit alcohol dehydrogenase family)
MGRSAGKVAFVTGVVRGRDHSHAMRLAAQGAEKCKPPTAAARIAHVRKDRQP